MPELDPEDTKLLTLARASFARANAAAGGAVRDDSGRTYTAVSVSLPSLTLSALQVAVAMAVSSGASDLEAAAIVTDGDKPTDGDLAAVRDLRSGVPVFVAHPDGSVHDILKA